MALLACGESFSGGNEGNGGASALGGAGGVSNGSGGDAQGGAVSVGGGVTGSSGAGGGGAIASAYRQAILDDHPLVYWRMGIPNARVVTDETGGGNDLVLQGTGHESGVAGAIAGDDDPALGFDGAASYAIATDARALDFAGNAAFTLECWARRSAGGASYFQHVISNVEGSAGNRNGYALWILPEPASTDYARSTFEYDQPGADFGISGPVGEAETWTYYAASYDGSTVAIYVDGTLSESGTVTGSITPRTGQFAIGRSADGNGAYFKGAVDEVAIYPRALSTADIARHFDLAK